MTLEEFEEFTRIVENMKEILGWAKTNSNGAFLANEHGGLECADCPLYGYYPEWANLSEGNNLCLREMGSCIKRYENTFEIWYKENAK